MPSFANTRRWTRHEVDFPVRVFTRSLPQAVPGRGTELGAGGMALYAGVELKTSQTLEVEFIAAAHVRVPGVIRNRQGYCFGLEFVTPLPIGGETRVESVCSEARVQSEPGPLSPRANELFQKVKAARGNAAAYALLAQVLTLGGRHEEARKAADRAFHYFCERNAALRNDRARRRRQFLQELQALRAIMVRMVDTCDRGPASSHFRALLADFPELRKH